MGMDLEEIKAIGKVAGKIQNILGKENANRKVTLVENNLVILIHDSVSSTDMVKLLRKAERIGTPTIGIHDATTMTVTIDMTGGPLRVPKVAPVTARKVAPVVVPKKK